MINLTSDKPADQIRVGDPVLHLSSRFNPGHFSVGSVEKVTKRSLLVKFFIGGAVVKADIRTFTWREYKNGGRLWAESHDMAAAKCVAGWDASVLLFPEDGPYKESLKNHQAALFDLLPKV